MLVRLKTMRMDARNSLWFIPAVLTLSAAVLAFGLVQLESNYPVDLGSGYWLIGGWENGTLYFFEQLNSRPAQFMIDKLPHDADGDALRRLVATGSDLSKEMELDFTGDVPDSDRGSAFAEEAKRMGFRTHIYQDDESRAWSCNCTRTMIPALGEIVAIQAQLNDLGRPFGATCDGWGSFGNS